jgi:hypothetical protein
MFTSQRDVSLVRKLNRELMGNIITQQAAFYQYMNAETKVNIYGEAAEEKYFNGPFLFNCLINRANQQFDPNPEGISEYGQGIQFYFLRDDLVDADVVPQVGDVILYQEGYYGVQGIVINQYWGGKNPQYPNNDSDGQPNPINPGLEGFGNNLSILCDTYYIPADKLSISPYQERF